MFTYIALIITGIVLLYGGGEFLVRGAVSLAHALGVSPLVIGVTVVAFATSCPELFASLTAAFQNEPAVALGAVMGSNTANLGLILGLTALLYPLAAQRNFIRREVPIMIVSSALLIPVCWNGHISRLEGISFLLALAVFVWYQIWQCQQEPEPISLEENSQTPPLRIGMTFLMVAAGVCALVIGAHALIKGSVALAQMAEIPERVIGLTLVAVGTSLPEIASSIVAALRRSPDLVLGNLIGSNIFNILGILGVTTAIHPIAVEWSATWIDLTVMMGITLLTLPFLATGLRVGRREGFVLVALYSGYVYYLFAA